MSKNNNADAKLVLVGGGSYGWMCRFVADRAKG